MASDSELIGRLREFLESSDLNTTTTATVRRRLEEDLGIDLSDKKAFIREQVDLYLQSRFEEAETGGADRLEEADSEEPVRSDEEEEEEEEGTSHGKGDVVPVKSPQKERKQKQKREEKPDEPKQKRKRQKGGKSGFLAPLHLSDALVKFLGTGEGELSRGDVVKRIWTYIKENNLQDPSDKRRILCDEKLKELFDADSFHGFTVSKFLVPHFIKPEQLSYKTS